MTGLREFLIEKAAAIRGLAASKPNGADWHETVAATCVSDDRTGVRKLRIRDWQFVGDSGPGFGGFSLGPSSPELLCGVISTCLTHTYQIGACMQGVPVDRIEVRVTCENNDARFGEVETNDPPVPFNFEAVVTLDAADASDEQLAGLHRWAGESCPLTNLIRKGAPVKVRVA